jgi:ankyrin repeat protein
MDEDSMFYIDIDIASSSDISSIFYAIIYGKSIEYIKTLLINGDISLNITNLVQMTPLLYAIMQNNIPLLKLLLEYGADPNFVSNGSANPLIVSAQHRHFEIAKLLIEYGANINICDHSGKTALIYASKANNAKMLKFLLEKGADIYISDNTGNTALMYANSTNISIFQPFANKSNRKGILTYITAAKMCQLTSTETKIGKFAKVSAGGRIDWLMQVSSFLSEDVTTTKL